LPQIFFGAEMENHQFTAEKTCRRETPMYRAFAASRPSTPNQLNVNSQPRTLARLAESSYLCNRNCESVMPGVDGGSRSALPLATSGTQEILHSSFFTLHLERNSGAVHPPT
jgi:hypothetical protein